MKVRKSKPSPTGCDEWVFVLEVADGVDVVGLVFPGRGDLEEGAELSQAVFAGGLDPDFVGSGGADRGGVAVDAVVEVIAVGDDQRAGVLGVPGGEEIERSDDGDGHVDAGHAEEHGLAFVEGGLGEEVLADDDGRGASGPTRRMPRGNPERTSRFQM